MSPGFFIVAVIGATIAESIFLAGFSVFWIVREINGRKLPFDARKAWAFSVFWIVRTAVPTMLSCTRRVHLSVSFGLFTP